MQGAVFIGRVTVALVYRKMITIEFIQTIPGAKPELTLPVLVHGNHRILRKTVFRRQMGEYGTLL